MSTIPSSINLHITNRCNYHCRFCFSHHKGSTELGFHEWKQLIDKLTENGVKKINIAGGEPTLIPFLPTLLKYIHDQGIFSSIISNGTQLTPSFLECCQNHLDLVGLSIDSANSDIEKLLGRGNCLDHVSLIRNRAKIIHNLNIPLKINTVICSLNWNEDMHDLIKEIHPFRWKVLQCYVIAGMNDQMFGAFKPATAIQYEAFVRNHEDLNPISESNSLLENSYCMITPDGRFYQSIGNHYLYSGKILEIGVQAALNQISFDHCRFIQRDGYYFLKRKKEKIHSSNIPF